MSEPQQTNSTATLKAADLTVTPPEPSAHVVGKQPAEPPPDTPPPPSPPAAAPLPPRVDAKGTRFDPERHLDKLHPRSGVWMPKKPRRGEIRSSVGPARRPAAVSQEPANGAASRVAPDEPAPDAPQPGDEYKAAALAACSILYASGMTLGGDEWRPSDDEHVNICAAFESYFRAKGTTEISPGWALTIALVAYAGPRFRRPKTVTTLQKIGAGFQRLALWWRARRTTAAIPGNAP